MKPLLILKGTGSFGVEIADVVSEIEGFRVAGFVQNADPQNTQAEFEGLPVLWVEDAKALAATHWAVCAISAVERRGFIERVAGFGFRFATLVHPTARVSATSSLGEGTIVSAGAVIAAHTQVGRHVIVNRGVLIGHHTTIGDYTFLGPGANIAGAVAIGEAAFVGIGAIVSDHLTIGKRCFLSAGAVVTRNVSDGMRVVTSNTRAFHRNPE
jgi:sugar O-acyltransferase (sialic acid O-acetyltransferase NeuD family)